MLPAIKSEVRKLLTVRSTYIILTCMALLTLFFAGYTEGFKADPKMLSDPNHLASEVRSALQAITGFCGLVAILLFSHEYRYNTIMHSLTNAKRRSNVLLAKILVMTAFAVFYALFLGSLSPLTSYLGTQLAGHEVVAQSIPYSDLLWQGIFYVWGYAMLGLLLVALSRNQVFSVVALFFIPVIESIAALLLKAKAIYLPYTALGAVMNNNPAISEQKAALVFVIWLVATWLVAWLLFVRRDATNSRG